SGSLGIDLEVSRTITLFDTHPAKIPTTTYGPLSSDGHLGALLVGRSSSGINGLIVLPGVIDPDYMGQIMIVAYTPFPPCTIEQGTSIAQLVLIEQHYATPKGFQIQRGSNGFGSTGKCFVNLAQKMHQRPILTITLQCGHDSKQLPVMCDTGADVTIIA
ncbi:POK9 protein, partial [Brachypteracias leptosomus]|nr:POK9 protein [Brachypteracias leptosomus]